MPAEPPTYRFLFEHAPVMMHSIDRDARLTRVNFIWLRTFGYQAEQVLGRKSSEFLTDDSREFVASVALPSFWKIGSVDLLPLSFLTEAGKVIDVLLSSRAKFDAAGHPTGTVSVIFESPEWGGDHNRMEGLPPDPFSPDMGSAIRARLATLSPREIQVFRQVSLGMTNKQMARTLGISPKTVEIFRRRVNEKMKARSIADLVMMAIVCGIRKLP